MNLQMSIRHKTKLQKTNHTPLCLSLSTKKNQKSRS